MNQTINWSLQKLKSLKNISEISIIRGKIVLIFDNDKYLTIFINYLSIRFHFTNKEKNELFPIKKLFSSRDEKKIILFIPEHLLKDFDNLRKLEFHYVQDWERTISNTFPVNHYTV